MKPPVFVSVTLLDIEGYVIDNNQYVNFQSSNFPEHFSTPLTELQQLDPEEFELEHLRPVLDRLWFQAGRSNGSPYLENVDNSL